MKIYNIALVVSMVLLQSLQGYERCSHYDIGDIYHHGNHMLCLRKSPELSRTQLTHIFNEHLKKSVLKMNLSDQPNLTDAHLEQISESSKSKRIVSLNLRNCKQVGYDGLLALLKSPYLGSICEDEPLYLPYDNTEISIIKVEIAGTLALEQYETLSQKNGERIFPFPIRDRFEINYTCPSGRHIVETVCGYKELSLTNNGERIKRVIDRNKVQKNL